MVAGWFSRPTKRGRKRIKARPAFHRRRKPEHVKYAMDGFSPRQVRRVLWRLENDPGDHLAWSTVKVRAFNIAKGVPQISLRQAISMDRFSAY